MNVFMFMCTVCELRTADTLVFKVTIAASWATCDISGVETFEEGGVVL